MSIQDIQVSKDGGLYFLYLQIGLLEYLQEMLIPNLMTIWYYFYGARAIDEVFFLEDFLELEKEFPNFHFHLALDRPDPKADALGVKYTPGFIAPVMGDTYLKQHDAPEDIEYYLCGPPMMSKTVLDLLHSLGVEDDMIMFDNFGG